MRTPRYSEAELWNRIVEHDFGTIPSLEGKTWHTIIIKDTDKQRYKIQYPRRYTAWVHLHKLYTLYCEVYQVGSLTRAYMNKHCRRLLNRSTWQIPGAAMLAILPLLDDTIYSEGGALYIRNEEWGARSEERGARSEERGTGSEE